MSKMKGRFILATPVECTSYSTGQADQQTRCDLAVISLSFATKKKKTFVCVCVGLPALWNMWYIPPGWLILNPPF